MATDPYLDEEQPSSGFNPMDLLRLFVRRKWLFIIPFVVCLGMAYLAIKTMHPIYYAAGQIKVMLEPTAARTLNDNMPRYGRSKEFDHETMALVRTFVTSPRFLEQLVHDLDLAHSTLAVPQDKNVSAPGRTITDRLTSRLDKMIRIDDDGDGIYRIGLRGEDPDLVYRLAQEIVTRFVQEEQASRLQRTTSTRDFLDSQRKLAAQNLEDKQKALTQFQRSLLSDNLTSNPVNEQNLTQADAILSQLQRQARETREDTLPARLAEARAALPAISQLASQIHAEASFLSLVRELTDLETNAEEAELTNARTVADSQNLLGSKRLELDSILSTRVAKEYPDLPLQDRNAVSQYLFWLLYEDVYTGVERNFAQYIQDYRDFMTRQPQQSATLSRLQREVESAQDLLHNIEQDISRENLSLAASMSEIGYRIEVYRAPRRPLAPIEPDKKRLGMMGFALALAMGAGLVLLSEMLDRSFKSVQQIERTLGLKVIGALPVVTEGAPFQKYHRRRVLLWIVTVIVILGLAAVGLLWIYPRMG